MALAPSQSSYRADRRRLLKFALFSSLAGLAPPVLAAQARASAAAAPPMPIVDASFPVEIAPGVFLLSNKHAPLVPNVGIVVGREKVLVVDCGLGIASGQNVLNAVRQLAPGRRIVLTITHAHPEHAFGAQVFKAGGAHIYYSRVQHDYLLRSGAKLLADCRANLPPQQRHLLDGVTPALPDEIYDAGRAALDLGGRQVEFRTWNVAHTAGDQIIHLPQEGIVFAGDLIEEPMLPLVASFPPMIEAQREIALADILRLQPRLIVPGHGSLGGAEIARNVQGQFQEIRARWSHR